jgi:hypothetical protein
LAGDSTMRRFLAMAAEGPELGGGVP